MKKAIIAILMMTVLSSLGGCFSRNANDGLFIECEILFDGDGDGVKSDLAVLSALGGSGGSSVRAFVFESREGVSEGAKLKSHR